MSGVRSYLSGLSLMLLVVSALLGGLLYLQWQENVAANYQQSAASGSKVKADSVQDVVPPFVAAPIQSLSEITQRPLFTEGRTPPEQPAQNAQGQVTQAPLKLRLEGVAITPQNKVAVITDLQTNELLRLSLGMSHGDWKVTEVAEDQVKILQGEREITLTLELEETSTGGVPPKRTYKLPVVRQPLRR